MIIDDNSIDRYIAEISIVKNSFAQQVIAKESAVSGLEYLALHANEPALLPDLIFSGHQYA